MKGSKDSEDNVIRTEECENCGSVVEVSEVVEEVPVKRLSLDKYAHQTVKMVIAYCTECSYHEQLDSEPLSGRFTVNPHTGRKRYGGNRR